MKLMNLENSATITMSMANNTQIGVTILVRTSRSLAFSRIMTNSLRCLGTSDRNSMTVIFGYGTGTWADIDVS